MAPFVPFRRCILPKSSFFKLSHINKRSRKRCYCTKKKMLTKNEAVSYLEKQIRIKDVKTKLNKSPLDLLKEFTTKYSQCVPFHNLSILNTNPKKRRLPDFESIRLSGLRGEGGPCYPQALFINWLLTALGYETFLIACKIRSNDYPYTHVSSVVKDLVKEGDLYLVDLSAGFATTEPVPLHDLPKYYNHAFSDYRFIQNGNDYLRQYRFRTEAFFNRLIMPVDPEGWGTLYLFEAIPRTVEFIGGYQEKVYTRPGYGDEWYLLSLRLSLYPKGKAITLKNRTLRIWDKSTGNITLTELPGTREIKEAINQYFPMLKHIDIDATLNNWQKEVAAWNLKKEKGAAS